MTTSDIRLTASDYQNTDQPLLLVYAAYRLVLTLIIWVLFFTDTGIGEEQQSIFIATASVYSLVNTVLLYAAALRWQPRYIALLGIIASDILAIQLIAQTSGDVGSGISVLMLVSVAAGSLFLTDNKALLVPAFASITLLISVTVSVLQESANRAEIVASGWLGFLFFVTAALVGYLSTRLLKSDQLARRESAHAQKLLQLNSLVINRMQTGILVIEKTGNIVSSNNAAQELLQFSGESSVDSIQQIDIRLYSFLSSILNSASLKNDSPHSLHLEYGGRNLKLVWIMLSETDASEFLVFIEDLSKIAQQAQQLKLSSLGKLTASIAHEIRNPLGAASHAAQLMLDIEHTGEDARLVEIIVNQTRRCSEIIDSVLSVSRGGTATIQQFNLDSWLDKWIDEYKIGNECHIQIIGDTSVLVRFDQRQLGQIISNLLDNAIRYSMASCDEPFAAIFVSIDEQQRPRIDILDKGDGVKQEDVGHLFEPFFTRSKRGSGLGLYLCRELCEANQATISYIHQPAYTASQLAVLDLPGHTAINHCFRIQFSHPQRTALFPEAEFGSRT